MTGHRAGSSEPADSLGYRGIKSAAVDFLLERFVPSKILSLKVSIAL